jgi:preprotein translocase subunit SecG
METAILVLHVLAAVSVIGLVLMQHGKGADMGAAFGSGSAGSLFGSSGSANFLSRTTALLAGVFFATSLALTYFSYRHGTTTGVMDRQVIEQKSAPAPAGPQAPAAAPKPAEGTDSKAKEIPK